MEIIGAAAGALGKIVAKPAADAALRKELVVRTLKAVRLDPKYPPRDFDSIYAYTLIEYCADRPAPVLAFFRDRYVLEAFRTSFGTGDGKRLRDEVATAVQRNAETGEFGHLGHGFDEHVEAFTTAFQRVVDRSREPHEIRAEQKIDALLALVAETRVEEERHRTATEPERTGASPAARLMADVREWFDAVGYLVRETWETADGSVALLVDVPQRRGRYDTDVMLCVDGELGPHHLRTLAAAVAEREAAEGWGIARLAVAEAARRRAESDEELFCYTFDELIELEADFESYIGWVEAEVARRELDERYVPLSCRKEEVDPATGETLDTSVYDWRDGGLDRYVEGWLREPDRKHLSLLGEFGMGKSWFGLHLAGEMARGWRDAKRRGLPRPRVPLVIPLRDYAKQTSVEALLSDFFFHKHRIALRSYDVFRVLNRMGRLLLVFDGFDEMAARADRNTMVANFWELANAVEPGAKVLLSSRTEHFPHAAEARDVLNARVSDSPSSVLRQGPSFDIVELLPFDDDQIRGMLGHLMSPDKAESLMAYDDVRDLMRRPVMSELVLDALPEIERGAPIDLARIYLYAIRRKMDRDIEHERTFTSRADKLYFLCELAWEMLSSNRLTLNYRDFPEQLRRCFGPLVASQKDLDYWAYDMRNQSMLVRDAEGDYGPAHKSLLEFLVAYKLAAELGVLAGDFLSLLPVEPGPDAGERTWSGYFGGRGPGGELPSLGRFRTEPLGGLAASFGSLETLEPVVVSFLREMASEDLEASRGVLLEVIASTASGETDPGAVGGYSANLLAALGEDFDGVDLRGTDLSGFEPSLYTVNASMKGADLRGAQLTDADLAWVDLTSADLRGATLSGVSVLSSHRSVTQLVAHPGGAITAVAGGEAFHWPDGDLAGAPRIRDLPGILEHDGSLLTWGENDWAYAHARAGEAVASRDGERLMELPPYTIAQVIWGGRAGALVHHRTYRTARVVDPVSGEQLVELTVHDPAEVAGFGPHQDGVSAWSIGAGHLALHRFTPEHPGGELIERVFLGTGRLDVRGDAATVWTFTHDGDLVLVDLSRGRVRRLSQQEWGGPFPSLTATLDPPGGNLYLGRPDKLSLFRPGPPGFEGDALTHAVALDVSVLRFDPVRNAVITGSASGEIMVRDPLSGEILAATSVNPHLRGARFSSACGLAPAVLDSIRRAGGIVD
ncbi:pentapeptide repeat-containing protein [Streptomyces sp. NPDC001941]|uniref:NACHT domain-containing protein n=1 Tax=Streptomyces sp. NPDC001941 TaxID=3154659 RepID=UPI00332259BB